MYRVCVCVQFSSSYLFIDLTLWLYLYSCVVPTRFLRFTRADKRREAGSGKREAGSGKRERAVGEAQAGARGVSRHRPAGISRILLCHQLGPDTGKSIAPSL